MRFLLIAYAASIQKEMRSLFPLSFPHCSLCKDLDGDRFWKLCYVWNRDFPLGLHLASHSSLERYTRLYNQRTYYYTNSSGTLRYKKNRCDILSQEEDRRKLFVFDRRSDCSCSENIDVLTAISARAMSYNYIHKSYIVYCILYFKKREIYRKRDMLIRLRERCLGSYMLFSDFSGIFSTIHDTIRNLNAEICMYGKHR